MRKISLLLFGFSMLLGVNAYSQSSKEKIPELVQEKAAEYLKWVNYCPGEPIIEKAGEKLEDRTSEQGMKIKEEIKDGIKDKITLYHIKNDCPWINVPNYIVYTQIGLGNGTFLEKGSIEYIISRDDKTWESIPLKEEW
ncbi:hypothetical protein KAI04_00795 [Candidatus Pacearchaeota archaeon]|nr:hypothetical protein [Candidatus Pacearchaeota archaeon]